MKTESYAKSNSQPPKELWLDVSKHNLNNRTTGHVIWRVLSIEIPVSPPNNLFFSTRLLDSGGSRKFWWGGDFKHKTSKIRMSSPKLRASRKFKQFYRPKSGGLQKKKKKNKGLHHFTKIESDFSAEIGNSNNFFAQNQVVSKKQKKKKGLHQNWERFFGRNRKFKQFLRPKSGVLQKKKKGLHQNWERFFGRIRYV